MPRLLPALTLFFLAVPLANATTIIWRNTENDFNSSTAWVGSVLPGPADIATFDTLGADPNLSADLSIAGLNFSTTTGAWHFTSNPGVKLTLLATGTGDLGAINSATTDDTNQIAAALVLGGAAASTQTFTQAGGGTLELNGIISSTHSITLGLAGTGTFNLNGANTYTGTTQWTEAGSTTAIGNAAAFGTSALNVAASITLIANADLTGANKLTNTIALGATLTIGAGGSLEFGGNVDLGGAARTIAFGNGFGTTTFDGVISNDGGLGVTFAANATNGPNILLGTSTYSGPTTLTGVGSISVSAIGNAGSSGPIGSGSRVTLGDGTLAGGTLKYLGAGETTNRSLTLAGSNAGGGGINASGTGALVLVGNFTNSATANKTFTLSGTSTAANEMQSVIGDASGNTTALTKSGTGTWVLSSANTYTGLTTVNGGLLQLSGSGTLGAGAALLRVSSGTLDLNSTHQTTGTLTLAGGTVISTGGGGSLTSTSFLLQGGSASAVLAGSGTLIKSGSTATLSGANSYTGKTSIQSGILSVNTLASINGGNSALGAPTSVSNGTIDLGSTSATGTLRYTGVAVTTDRVINFAGTTGGGTLDASGSGALVFSSAFTATGNGTKTLTLTGTSTAANTIQGAIVENGVMGLTKTGTGTWVVSGANSFSGKTRISNGTLSVNTLASVGGGNSALGAPTSVSNGTIDLGSLSTTGTLRYTGAAVTTDRVINLAGTTGGGVIDASGSGALVFSSAFTSTAGSSKTLTLTGSSTAANTIQGAIVQTGVVGVTKSGAGTWMLAGTNAYTGRTTISGGTLRMGANNVFADTSTMTLGGGTLAAASHTDTLGALTLSLSSTLDLGSTSAALAFGNSSGTSWSGTLTLLNYASGNNQLRFGADSTGLTVAQLADISATNWNAFALDGSGYLIATSTIPEPSTYAAIFGAVVLTGVVIRRQRMAKKGV